MTPPLQPATTSETVLPERTCGKTAGKTRFFPWIIAVIFSGGVVLSLLAPSPVDAQEPTPTPQPAYSVTATAAAVQIQQAQQDRATADQLDARAAEIRRNADAQAQQAAQAYADAMSAVAAQDYARIGISIGQGEAALAQLRDSTSGQASIIATLTSASREQADRVAALTNEAQQLRADKATILNAYNVVQAQVLEAQSTPASINPAVMVLAIAFVIVVAFVFVAWRVSARAYAPQVIYQAEIIDRDHAEEKGNLNETSYS